MRPSKVHRTLPLDSTPAFGLVVELAVLLVDELVPLTAEAASFTPPWTVLGATVLATFAAAALNSEIVFEPSAL